MAKLIRAGGRIHQAGCNGCIGMGQAPANERISLRTVPRNFPGRSGTKEDLVYLCSPETAAASALTGVITDPRRLGIDYPRVKEPKKVALNTDMLMAPAPKNKKVELIKGTNIKPLPNFEPLPNKLQGPVLLKVGDNISTDEIMPAGAKVLPFRSNIPEISKFVYIQVDESYYERAMRCQNSGHFIVGGSNYGQGSSREHAALAPLYLGLKAVIVKSYARIHRQNLINFGIIPFTFVHEKDYAQIEQGNELVFENLHKHLQHNKKISVLNKTKNQKYELDHSMTERQIEIVLA